MNVKYHLIIGFVLLVLVGIFFWFFPQVDIWTSHQFMTDQQQFVWFSSWWALDLRHLMNFFVWVTVILSIVGFASTFIWKSRPKWITKRLCGFVFLCFLVAPGLVVNVTLKNNWGRPRPQQVLSKNAHDHYQKVWVASNVCPTNCSFVCGDCSASFAFFCFVPLLRRRRKKLVFAIVALESLLFGAIRLGQGGHFLSDVLSAYLIDYIIIMALYGLLFRWPFGAKQPALE